MIAIGIASALVLASLQAPPTESAIEQAVRQAETEWRAGRFHETAEAASAALDLIQASDCPMRSDAALVAFMGAVTGFSQNDDGWPASYLFWVAKTVDDALEILPEHVADVATSNASEPGSNLRLDRFFMSSPYHDEDLSTGCAEAYLDVSVLNADPTNADHVFIAFNFDQRIDYTFTSPSGVSFVYPATEGSQLAEQVFDRRDWYQRSGGMSLLVLDPCANYPMRHALIGEICRENHPDAG